MSIFLGLFCVPICGQFFLLRPPPPAFTRKGGGIKEKEDRGKEGMEGTQITERRVAASTQSNHANRNDGEHA
jgi:hypothetical protein